MNKIIKIGTAYIGLGIDFTSFDVGFGIDRYGTYLNLFPFHFSLDFPTKIEFASSNLLKYVEENESVIR